MPSHRLEHYFPPATQQTAVKRRLTFLDLPYSARKKVYEYAELVYNVVDLNWLNFKANLETEFFDAPHVDYVRFPCHHIDIPVRRDGPSTGTEERWIVNLPDHELLRLKVDVTCLWCDYLNPFNLLFVSKQISTETITMLYSQGTFQIDQGLPNGLRRLKSLGSDAWSALGCLSIRLDLPQSQVDDCENYKVWPEPLDVHCRSHKRLINDWANVVEMMTKNVQPGQLKLYLCFRAVNVETVQTVMLQWQRLPSLREYGICTDIPSTSRKTRLEHDRKLRGRAPLEYLRSKNKITASRVCSLIEQATKHTSRHSSTRSAFRYLDLPQELRFQILQYSDLVIEEGIQWQPTSRTTNFAFSIDCQCTFSQLEEVGDCLCDPESSRYTGLTHRFPPEDLGDQRCCGVCGPSEDKRLCFCSTPAANWSSSCKCHRYHHSLFYVSRQVRQDAIPVYYKYNRFILSGFGCSTMRHENRKALGPPVASPFDRRCELSLYFSMLTLGAIGHIRWLEWMMPEHSQAYMDSESPIWHDYLDTVQMMEHAMNIPQLTLVINMTAFGSHRNCDPREYFNTPLDLCTNRERWKRYANKIKPLVRLRHLKDFFVYLRRDAPQSLRLRLEKEFEQLIKGSDYDSLGRGKPQERFRWYETYRLDLEMSMS